MMGIISEIFEEVNNLVPGIECGMEQEYVAEKIRDELIRLRNKIDSAKTALRIALEDTGDQYYQNVLDDLEK